MGPIDPQEGPSKGPASSDQLKFEIEPPCTRLLLGDYPQTDRCLRTSSLFIVQSVHLTLPHEFRGRSDRECQDLRLGRLGVPRPARIAARLTLCPRDLPGLRIRLTTVPCILPERLELTSCHRGPAGGSGRRSARDPPPGHVKFPLHHVR
ncbi:hypothetical protein Prudu_411S000200 [Prunus dulcis]|uniref:F-box family protein with DUF295 n=1 Tax=Prunus dulcis TaxID=3755 RepID=A0A5H2Y614_PRUDU|nr:hypothetical protein Prudu_411S000200 [Prunus dulcis]